MSIYKDSIIVQGGQIPSGEVTVSGAKNSATRLLAACTLSDGKCILNNYPSSLVDSKHKVRFIELNGGHIDTHPSHIETECTNYLSHELDDYFFPIRTTYLLVPGLLKRAGIALVPYPGGCNIGDRKYDLHVMVWESFGFEVKEEETHIEVKNRGDIFRDVTVEFPISTVGGTENALLCGAINSGKTTILNAYITPEIDDLISFLELMGVEIQVFGRSTIEMIGKQTLKGANYSVMPDRIEALTWISYSAITAGNIMIKNVPFNAMEIPLMHLKSCGLDFYRNSNSIIVNKSCLQDGYVEAFEVAAGTHPGIISDMQPFYVLLGLIARGTSRIHDYRYPERISYIEALNKFVTKSVRAQKGLVEVSGGGEFRSSHCSATDLRGTMACLLAALAASEGESTINGISMALRGYDDLISKLNKLNVKVQYQGAN